MKISKRDAELLLALAGLVVFLLLYLFVFNTFQTRTDTVQQEITTLQPQLQQLEDIYANLATYQSGIEKYRGTTADKLEKFPADIKEEDFMSYLLTLQAREGVDLQSISFSGSTLLSEFPGVIQKDGADTKTTMDAYSTDAVVTCQLTYPQLKSVISYLYAGKTQTSLNSVAVSFNAETGGLTGTFDIARYYVNYPGAVYTPEPLPEVPLGVTDPFGTSGTAGTAGTAGAH